MTLLHVRLARPVDFGKTHWLIWAPGLLLIITSTAVAGKCSYLVLLRFWPSRSVQASSLELISRASSLG